MVGKVVKEKSIARRAFVGKVAAGATALAGSAAIHAEEDSPARGAGLAAASPADLLLALVKQLDRERLEEEHLALLRLDLESNLRRSALLSSFALTNADEPAPIFYAWRAEG